MAQPPPFHDEFTSRRAVDYEALGDRFGRNLALDFHELGNGKGMEFTNEWQAGEHALFLERLALLSRLGATISDIGAFSDAAKLSLHHTLREADAARAERLVGKSKHIFVPHTNDLQ